MQLAALDTAQAIDDMDLPGFGLHPLKGEVHGRWAISVNGHWRLPFEFQDGNAHIVESLLPGGRGPQVIIDAAALLRDR